MRIISLVAVAVLAAGCFSDPGSPSDSGEDSTTSSGDTDDTTSSDDASTSDEADTDTDDTDTDTGEGDVPLDVGDDGPEPRVTWRFDGDLTEDLAGADAVAQGDVSFEDALYGQGARVSSGWIDASAAGPLVLANLDAFTLRIVLRQDTDAGRQTLWALGTVDDDPTPKSNVFFVTTFGGQLMVSTSAGMGVFQEFEIGAAPAVQQWHTLVLVFEDGEARVFWDGAMRSSAFFTPAETQSVTVGLASMHEIVPSSAIPLSGVVDEVSFFDQAISDDEALFLAQ